MLKVQYRGLDLMRVHASRTYMYVSNVDRDIQLASLESPWSRNKVLENIRHHKRTPTNQNFFIHQMRYHLVLISIQIKVLFKLIFHQMSGSG